MIKEVYGIYRGSIYEGGEVDRTLYIGKGAALRLIKDEVEELQEEHDELFSDEEGLPYQWKEKEKYYWTNGIEVIKLIEFDIR